MKKFSIRIATLFLALSLFSCDKQKDGLETPLADFPQVIRLADEGDGDLEDEDKFSFKISLSDRKDPDGDELGGKVVPLEQDVLVSFEVTGFEGFTQLSDFILGAEAFYEIDDCITSLDQGIDLNLTFDVNTGKGQVRFPAGIEEIEIEFETDDGLFDDNDFNTDERSITIQLTGIGATSENVVVNTSGEFVYEVQDDEGIYGEWELDVNDPVAFARFKELFGLINEDILSLDASEVDEITLVFEFEEVKAIVKLVETEIVDDCGSPSVENKEIEIEAEIEELSDDALSGDVEFGELIELGGGLFREFVYKGVFSITGSTLTIELEGEYGDDSTDAIVLTLEK